MWGVLLTYISAVQGMSVEAFVYYIYTCMKLVIDIFACACAFSVVKHLSTSLVIVLYTCMYWWF